MANIEQTAELRFGFHSRYFNSKIRQLSLAWNLPPGGFPEATLTVYHDGSIIDEEEPVLKQEPRYKGHKLGMRLLHLKCLFDEFFFGAETVCRGDEKSLSINMKGPFVFKVVDRGIRKITALLEEGSTNMISSSDGIRLLAQWRKERRGISEYLKHSLQTQNLQAPQLGASPKLDNG